ELVRAMLRREMEERNSTISLSRVQSRTCSGYAEARNGRKKFNHFVKPSAEPNLFGLCRGGKWTKKIQDKSTA
ncbi:hypothetical protein, partial [Alistipes communis]|uniref:hypothetical protein n=1 Tax=Alistipes communis TaxID=2585118 RepID=UPI003AB2925E